MAKSLPLLKLNLGCGYDHRVGYVNIDIDPQTKPDLVHDVTQKLPFPDHTITHIVMQDVLEHVTLEAGKELLAECHRLLNPTGQLQVRVPNVVAIVRKFWLQPDLMMHFLYGNTQKNGVWGAHKVGYTPRLIKLLGWQVGLELTAAKAVDTNWEFTFQPNQDSLHVSGSTTTPSLAKQLKSIWKTGQVQVSTTWLGVIWWHLTQPQKATVWYQTKVLTPWVAQTGGRLAGLAADAVFTTQPRITTQLTQKAKTSHLKIFTAS